jgi:signal peptidase I
MLSRRASVGLAAGLSTLVALTALLVAKATTLYRVPSASMAPTIAAQDVLLVWTDAYRDASPSVGDIVVFRSPETGSVEYLKRAVAGAGETIEVSNHRLFKQRKPVAEAYAHVASGPSRTLNRASVPLQRIPPAHFYALGDNRAQSADSRIFGPVPCALLRGRVIAVVWPLSHARVLGSD